MMKMDTTTVQLVLTIAEEGSISRASNRLGLAVAAASKRVTDLEQQLGTQLFKRMPHGVRITDSGTKLLAHVRQIHHLLSRLEGDALALQQGSDGRIIIGAPKAVVMQFLSHDLAVLQQRYPQITLQVMEENSKIIQQLLRDKVIDIGIFEKTSGFIDLDKFAYQQDQLVAVFHRGHFSLRGGRLSQEQLLELPIVTLGQGSAILAALQRAHQSQGRVFRNDFTVSGFDTMLALVRQGLGVGFMPPEVFRSLNTSADVVSADIDGQWHRRSYVLSYVEGRAQEHSLHNVVQTLLAPRC